MKQKVYAFYRCSYSWKKLNQQAKVKNVKLNKKHWLQKRFNESYLDRKRDVSTSGKETSPKIWSVASEGYKDTENHFITIWSIFVAFSVSLYPSEDKTDIF